MTEEERSQVLRHNANIGLEAVTAQIQKLDLLRTALSLPERTGDTTVDTLFMLLKLASIFVPGFRIVDETRDRGRGRQKEWNATKWTNLLADVRALQARRTGLSDSAACRLLSKSIKYNARWGKYDERTLRNQLSNAKNPEKNVLSKLLQGVIKSKIQTEKAVEDILIESFASPEMKNDLS